MSFTATVKGDLVPLSKKLEKKADFFGDFILKTALELNGKIQIRVQNKGQGSNGRALKKYSDRYAKYRKAFGRQAAYRDLTFSGNMWQSLSASKVSKNSAKMFFSGASDKEKAFYNDQKTPFFSLTKSERVFLKQRLEGFIKI